MKPEKIKRLEISKEEFLDIRIKLDLTQNEFAELLGLTKTQVYRIEKGQRGLSKTLQLLALFIYKEIAGKVYK